MQGGEKAVNPHPHYQLYPQISYCDCAVNNMILERLKRGLSKEKYNSRSDSITWFRENMRKSHPKMEQRDKEMGARKRTTEIRKSSLAVSIFR